MTQAGKVAEIFSVAGEAFTKLGTLAMALQPSGERTQDGSKWGDEEMQMLRDAVLRFGTDLEKISDLIKTKSANQIKTALKQKTMQNFLTVAPTGKNTPGSITAQLSKSPMKIQSIQRTIGQKSKTIDILPYKGSTSLDIQLPSTKRTKIDAPRISLLTTALPPQAIVRPSMVGIPVVTSNHGFQIVVPQPQVKNVVYPVAVPVSLSGMQSGVVQRVSNANTIGNVDVES